MLFEHPTAEQQLGLSLLIRQYDVYRSTTVVFSKRGRSGASYCIYYLRQNVLSLVQYAFGELKKCIKNTVDSQLPKIWVWQNMGTTIIGTATHEYCNTLVWQRLGTTKHVQSMAWKRKCIGTAVIGMANNWYDKQVYSKTWVLLCWVQQRMDSHQLMAFETSACYDQQEQNRLYHYQAHDNTLGLLKEGGEV